MFPCIYLFTEDIPSATHTTHFLSPLNQSSPNTANIPAEKENSNIKKNAQKRKLKAANKNVIKRKSNLSEKLKIVYFRKKIANANLQRRLMLEEHNIKKKYYEEKLIFFKEKNKKIN